MSTSSAAHSGYIRFPRAWMALPISPAAKCLLVHFCGAADADGASWYSYAQLSDLIGRSRASVAAYVAELRDAGLIETERQRTANGFNYRLRIRIAQWRATVAGWTADAARGGRRPARPKTERRVQPDERMNPSGSRTEIQENNAPAASPDASPPPPRPVFDETSERAWRRCHDHANDTRFSRPPSDQLLRAIISHSQILETRLAAYDRAAAFAAASQALRGFAARKRIPATSEEIAGLTPVLARRAPTASALAGAVEALSAAWPSHWRKLSTPKQLDRWLTGWLASEPDLAAELSNLWRFRNRALRAEAELRRRQADLSRFPAGNPDRRVAEVA